MDRVLAFFWNRYRPREGWLGLGLLAAAVGCLVSAVLEVGWVPEDGIVPLAAGGGLIMGAGLAKRPLSTRPAWLLIVLYALAVPALWLGKLWPPLKTIGGGWPAMALFWRQSGALFLDRAAGWWLAAVGGGSSRETIVFALGLALLAWLLAAFAGWSAFRWHRPLPGLSLIGLALAGNSYFGQAELTWLVLFIGLAVLLTAVLHFAGQEVRWQAGGVDYSDEVRLDLIFYAGAAALILMSAAMILPGFSLTSLARAFQQQPAVTRAEARLEELFAGVQPPRRAQPHLDGPGGGGTLPRAYLLGNPPELYETVMMTAVVSLEDAPAPYGLVMGTHWRGLTYDVYTGRGWALSEERQEAIPPGELISAPASPGTTAVQQSVTWIFDRRTTRYTQGTPISFADEVTVFWRGITDQSRVLGDNERPYTAVSQLNPFSPDQLRQADPDAVPPALLARYTVLPNTVPERVADLAREVTFGLDTPYDQARALEQFLRQYPYSLDVDLPPEDADPVDFFLFDLQTGYCDYYASAMVVMARSLGLPARMGIGFLPQPPDDSGVQTLYQINGHSWAEIYFGGVGWVEFEPTAAFPSPFSLAATVPDPAAISEDPQIEIFDPPPIPAADPGQPVVWGWWAAGMVSAAALGWVLFWQLSRKGQEDGVTRAYGRLQTAAGKIGTVARPSLTPAEFVLAFQRRLGQFTHYPQLARFLTPLPAAADRLARLYARQQYGRDKSGGAEEADRVWKRVRRPLQLLRIVSIFSSRKEEGDK